MGSAQAARLCARLYEQVVLAPDVFGPPMCVVLRRIVVRHALK
jgi:hypothetical protein